MDWFDYCFFAWELFVLENIPRLNNPLNTNPMDNHFPDEMTYWSERPTLPMTYQPQKRKKRLLEKRTSYKILKDSGGNNRLYRVVRILSFGFVLFTYKNKI